MRSYVKLMGFCRKLRFLWNLSLCLSTLEIVFGMKWMRADKWIALENDCADAGELNEKLNTNLSAFLRVCQNLWFSVCVLHNMKFNTFSFFIFFSGFFFKFVMCVFLCLFNVERITNGQITIFLNKLCCSYPIEWAAFLNFCSFVWQHEMRALKLF